MRWTIERIGVAFASASLVVMSLAADSISEKAKRLHFSSIVMDTHDDTTQRMLDPKFDLGARHTDGSIDIPRMKEGGLTGISFPSGFPAKLRGPKR